MPRLLIYLMGLLLPVAAAEAAPGKAACGEGGRCQVEEGYYLAAPPPAWDGVSPLPLVVYFHGWRSSPEATFRNTAMVRGVNRRGALFVAPFAPTGFWRQIGVGRAEPGRDELAYARRVMADIEARWPIDRNRTLASGFSRGASMVWNLACYGDDLFRAYLPIAGAFWHSNPGKCPAGAVNLRHIHGLADRIVAFDSVGAYNSMPITEAMELARGANACPAPANAEQSAQRYTCQVWNECGSGKELQLCLHEKGHSIPAEWVGEGLDWMDRLTLE